jgi:hypothetical protein
METAGGADKTFSSHPAGTADRARRARRPVNKGLRGKEVPPAAYALHRWPYVGQHRRADRLVRSSPEK